MASYRIGADIGGTFTDLVLIHESDGRVVTGKVPTTYPDPTEGVLQGVRRLLREAGADPVRCRSVIHGTTLVTNALIERRGAVTALLTTEGHRDALEIRRESRYDMYDLFLEVPPPLIPRDRRYGVRERMLADGSVRTPLDEQQVRNLARRLRNEGVESVAVVFLHSYRNPSHERRTRELLLEEAPSLHVSLSWEVQPEIREYERTSTTVCNAYVQPLADGYLRRLRERLARETGVECPLYIMTSSGGTCSVDTAARFPIRLLESGPAAGALAAAHVGRQAGVTDVLALDMGGTTAKACLIEGGRPLITREFEVARAHRFKRGSGMPVTVASVDLIEIGAGGGSIAWVDRLGLLRVGPRSAASDPGPACYGRGGEEATVTDADLLLGYLDAEGFLGGEMPLDRARAEKALRRLGERLGLTPVETAWGIHRIVNEDMAGAARVHAAERGKDPGRFTVVATGGAGPVHAYRVAEIVRAPAVIVPPRAGVGSSVGLLVAPLALDVARTCYTGLDGIDGALIERLYEEMADEARSVLGAAGVTADNITFTLSVDMRYARQGSEITVPVPEPVNGPGWEDGLRRSFTEAYRRHYGRIHADGTVEALTWRLTATGPDPRLPSPPRSAAPAHEARPASERPAFFPEAGGFVPTPVYHRDGLRPGHRIPGPAVVQERESTFVLGPRGVVTVDDHFNLVMTWQP